MAVAQEGATEGRLGHPYSPIKQGAELRDLKGASNPWLVYQNSFLRLARGQGSRGHFSGDGTFCLKSEEASVCSGPT